jgi:hypothetical protein
MLLYFIFKNVFEQKEFSKATHMGHGKLTNIWDTNKDKGY